MLVSAFSVSSAAKNIRPHNLSVSVQFHINTLYTTELLAASMGEKVIFSYCLHATEIFQLRKQCTVSTLCYSQ